MKESELSDFLGKYLGLPCALIFNDEGDVSPLCLKELGKLVKLPSGFSFSCNFRKPEPGEYFLDVKALVVENRLLVYRAIKHAESPSLIMRVDEPTPFIADNDMQKVSFNMDDCTSNANVAYIGGTRVTLLVPYIDSAGYVAVIDDDRDRSMLVHIDELRNRPVVNQSLKHEPNPDFILTPEEQSMVDALIAEVSQEYDL